MLVLSQQPYSGCASLFFYLDPNVWLWCTVDYGFATKDRDVASNGTGLS